MMKLSNTIVFLLFALFVTAQNPVRWTYEAKCLPTAGEYELIFKASIQEGWNIYSQYPESDEGPLPTVFEFEKGAYTKIGKCEESGEKKTVFEPLFNTNVTKFKHNAIFTQKVKVTDASKPIVGYLSTQACDDKSCLPPKDVDFAFRLPTCGNGGSSNNNNNIIVPQQPTTGNTNGGVQVPNSTIPNPITPNATTVTAVTTNGSEPTTTVTEAAETPVSSDPNVFDSKRAIDIDNPANGACGTQQVANDDNLWRLFLLSFVGGLVALLTPCVFPMIPLTVSFFTKNSGSRAKGIRNAILYGLSIIAIYVFIGIVITGVFGPNTLNAMATNPYVNTIFFILFVVFAISFFGYFEITLPSSWSTSTDQAADKGGLIGIFFMAFTLALVSFSCTGPIIGSLLVQTVSSSANMLLGFIPIKPLVGMFGFSLALALPFALFAMFPSWLNSLPKSGGWMNAVKVTLGFLELAFALKFLSTADLVDHWNWLRWEVFLGAWMLIFLGLGLYHFGIVRFPHDSPMKKMAIGNWVLALGSLAFVIYLGFGFQYKPLSLLSGLAPSYTYNYFGPKGCVHGIECFHDFDEAVAYAKKVNKPVFVDFTGYGCVNCRKMEENVWVKPEILKYLKEDYVVVSLYVDDEARLFPDDKQKFMLDKHTGQKLRTVGSKWSSFQQNNFKELSQPQYILMDNDGKTVLTHPKTFTESVTEYRDFLDCGVQTFKSLKK
jgi:thiol:disulfide interchange protein